MEDVVKRIELLQRAVRMRDIIQSTNRLHAKLQSKNYPKKKRRRLLSKRYKTMKFIKPKNNILDSVIQVMDSYSGKNGATPNGKVKFEHSVFETHDSVIVRLKVPENIKRKNIKAFVGTSSVSILLDEDSHLIILPQEIKREGASAKLKGNILEIRGPKLDTKEMHEISIHL